MNETEDNESTVLATQQRNPSKESISAKGDCQDSAKVPNEKMDQNMKKPASKGSTSFQGL